MRRIPKGKYKGLTLEWVEDNDPSYYRWVVTNEIDKSWFKEPPKKVVSKRRKKYYNINPNHKGNRLFDKLPIAVKEFKEELELGF